MPDRDIFSERERALEGAYFKKKDQELIEKLRRRTVLEAERRKISEEMGFLDEEIIEALQRLGYTRDTWRLLYLAPLVEVAWADGYMTDPERKVIFEIAQAHKITPDTPAYRQLEEWLNEKPSDQFLESSLRAVSVVNFALPPEQQLLTNDDLLAHAARIARASGGIGGMISDEEQKMLDHISAELKLDRSATPNIEKLQRRATLEAERRKIAEEMGIIDQELVGMIQDLGFTRETVRALPLVPLVQIAWSKGNITKRERELIYEIARTRGITEGAPTYEQLTNWIEHKPSEKFFKKALILISIVNHTLPEGQQPMSTGDLLSYCTSVAEASGGFLGLGHKVSDEERQLIEHITAELMRDHPEAAKKFFDQ
jgi:tellurite resistance protein